MIEVKLNLHEIPKEQIYVGEKGKYLTIQISEMQQPDKFGNTITVYIWDKETKSKIYIGKGKKRFEDGKPNETLAQKGNNNSFSDIDNLPF